MARPDDQPVSMLQGLQRVLAELGAMMAAPDADIDFLTTVQHAITAKIREGTQQAVTGGGPPGAAPGGPVPPQQIAPGGGAGMSGFGGVMGAPAPGMGAPGQGGIGTPSPDELRRVLAANGQAQ